MTIDCTNIQTLASRIKLIRECDRIRNGWLRMSTAFKYPNGSSVDIFVSNVLDASGRLTISDQGQTFAYLAEQGIRPWTTTKRKQMVQDICSSLGVKNENGELTIQLPPVPDQTIADSLVLLGQACIRIGEMQWAQRIKSNTTFEDEVEEFIESLALAYQPKPHLIGTQNSSVKADYVIHGRSTKTIIQTVSTANAATARGKANEILRRWVELENHRTAYNFITVFDASNDAFKENDIALLGERSMTIAFPDEKDEFKAAVAA